MPLTSPYSQFVHQHDGKWCIYQELSDGRYLTPEKKSPMSKSPRDSYFALEPLLKICYRYSFRDLAIARAKRLFEDGMFINKY